MKKGGSACAGPPFLLVLVLIRIVSFEMCIAPIDIRPFIYRQSLYFKWYFTHFYPNFRPNK